MHLVVYGDFNCPYSCLASVRVDGLVASGVAEVAWRAVEHDPAIATPSAAVVGELATMLDREVAEVRDLLAPHEELPIRTPPVQPNTHAAVAGYATADAEDAPALRRRLFGALWFDGRDIGDGPTLRDLGVDPDREADRLATWRDEWLSIDRRMVPMLVLPDGYVSRGLGALDRLARLAG
jgi:predicted DsbA family dithiol-disulfide isomerase